MLSIESLNAMRDVTAVLADKGVALRPVANSPLAEAMAATVMYPSGLHSLSEIDKLPLDLYQGNETRIQDGVAIDNVLDCYQEAASQRLGTILAGHVAHATTVVLPTIFDLNKAIKDAQNTEVQEGLSSWNVTNSKSDHLLDVPAIASEVEKYAGIEPRRELELNLDFADLSDEAIVALMKTGSDIYDAAVDAFVADAGIANVREAYSVVFTGQKAGYAHYDLFRADRKKAQVRNSVVFLVSSRLLIGGEGIPEPTGASGLSAGRRSTALKSFQEVSAFALAAALNFLKRDEREGKLISNIDGKTIYVNKAVYDRYMSDGGDVEIILGAVVSGRNNVVVDELVSKMEEFRTAWTRYSSVAKLTAASEELLRVRGVITNFVRKYITTTEDAVVRANGSRVLTNAVAFVDRMGRADLKDADYLALRVVCDCIYNHTNGRELLAGVNEAMANNPDISKEDALNQSVMAYVANWFASQIEIA